MDILTVLILSFALATDAFAVSVTNGISFGRQHVKFDLLASLAFGAFQGLMPIIGYYGGSLFVDVISQFDHYLAFGLLCFIGGKNIYDAIKDWNETPTTNESISPQLIFSQAIATSIDALAVGISLAALEGEIYASAALIATVTFALCLVGHFLGKKIGHLCSNWAHIVGGAVLVAIGGHILIEGLFV